MVQVPGVRRPEAKRYWILDSKRWLQDDRRRPRSRPGPPRRLGAAAAAVPLRAVRDGRPPPRLELAVPLELDAPARAAATPSIASGASGAASDLVEDPECERLAVAQVAPARDATRVRDQRFTLPQHGTSRREQHLHEACRHRDELDALVRELGRGRAPGREAARGTPGGPACGSSSSGTARSLSAWRGSSRRAEPVLRRGRAPQQLVERDVEARLGEGRAGSRARGRASPAPPVRSRSARRPRGARCPTGSDGARRAGRGALHRAGPPPAPPRASAGLRVDVVAEDAPLHPRRAALRLGDPQPAVADVGARTA